MRQFFCSVQHKMLDQRLTLTVEAIDHEQAAAIARGVFDEMHPRKIGEIRQLDVSTIPLPVKFIPTLL